MLSLCSLSCLVRIALCAVFISATSSAHPFSCLVEGEEGLWQICNVQARRKGHRLLIQQREQKPELGASWEFHHQPGERKREQERGGQSGRARKKRGSGKEHRSEGKKVIGLDGPG